MIRANIVSSSASHKGPAPGPAQIRFTDLLGRASMQILSITTSPEFPGIQPILDVQRTLRRISKQGAWKITQVPGPVKPTEPSTPDQPPEPDSCRPVRGDRRIHAWQLQPNLKAQQSARSPCPRMEPAWSRPRSRRTRPTTFSGSSRALRLLPTMPPRPHVMDRRFGRSLFGLVSPRRVQPPLQKPRMT